MNQASEEYIDPISKSLTKKNGPNSALATLRYKDQVLRQNNFYRSIEILKTIVSLVDPEPILPYTAYKDMKGYLEFLVSLGKVERKEEGGILLYRARRGQDLVDHEVKSIFRERESGKSQY